MRIIHTSDWHLGQNFMGKSRALEHQAFLSWLLEQIKKNNVDALIVAGDIFDTGSPPSYAREMYNRFIVAIHSMPCQLIILAGNHDSVATLNESKDLLACLNTHVISCVADSDFEPSSDKDINNQNNDTPLISLTMRDGNIGAILCAVPFIRPRDVIFSKAGQSADEKRQAMQNAISEYYHEIFKHADTLRKEHLKKHKITLPIIATGHLATVGASTSDSVREIYIGTLDAFPAKAFPPADYIALGHIHQSQKVAKSNHIRYSGSPIALSFDEAKMTKSVLLVDFNKGKFKQANALNIPAFQSMHSIKGDLASIESQLNKLADTIALSKEQHIWVEIVVSSQDYLNDLQVRIQKMVDGSPIEVLRLRRERQKQQDPLQSKEKETLNELGVMDVFERRLSEENWGSGDDTGNTDNTTQKRLKRIKHHFKTVLNELETTNTGDTDSI